MVSGMTHAEDRTRLADTDVIVRGKDAEADPRCNVVRELRQRHGYIMKDLGVLLGEQTDCLVAYPDVVFRVSGGHLSQP